MQSEYYRAIEKVSKELNINPKQVDKIYRAYTRNLITRLSSVPFETIRLKEDFNNIQASINLPSIGKIYCDWEGFLNVLKRKDYVKCKENKID